MSSDLIVSLRHWAQEMERSAAVAEEAGADVVIIDGNRAIASVLWEAALALRAQVSLVLAARRLLDECTDGDGFTEATGAELLHAVEQAEGGTP